ncbi:hypothetical protein [Agromyces soli]
MTALAAALAIAPVVPSAPAHADDPLDPRLQEFTSAVGVDASAEGSTLTAVKEQGLSYNGKPTLLRNDSKNL